MHQNARLPLFSRLLSAGRVPTISTRRRMRKPSLRCPPTQQQTHIPLPASHQYRSTHLLAYGAMEVRPTMTRIPAHRPTCTHTASKHRDAQRTSSSSTKTVLHNRLHTHQPWPTPLALLQRDQTTPPKPPSKTDAATSPILRFQRARTCARTPLAPPPAPPWTPTVLAQQLHVPVAPGWNDADGADHNGRSTVLLCPRPRPRPWALCGVFLLLRRGGAADMARAARARLTLPFSKERRIAALQRPRARNLEIVKGVSARPGPGTRPLIRERENHCEPRGWRKWWARGELADQVADLLPSGGGGAREHFRWEGEKGEGKEGVPKRLTVAYAPALPGKPQVFLLQERAARPNWT